MKKFLFLTSSFLLFSRVLLSAATVKMPIDGFVANPTEPVFFDLKWDEHWFGEKPATEYNHDLARIAAVFSEVSYVDIVKHPDNNELLGCYKALGVNPKTIEFHYDVNYSNPLWHNDQTAFSFASKQIESARGKRTLIFIVIRGTPLNANEWISNLNISDHSQEAEEFHEGFLRATKQIESALITYLLRNKIDIDDAFLFITGHSRGAAVSNLLAAQLYESEFFKTDNIYCYTFASPNVTTDDNVTDSKYGYIWNIVNGEDIVPTVPMNYGEWKYKKYGHILTLINNWNTDPVRYAQDYQTRMNIYFSRIMNRNYCPFNMGPFFPIQVTATATSLNKNVKDYYKGIKALRYKGEDAFNKIFPEKKQDISEESASDETEDFFASLDKASKTPGGIAGIAAGFVFRQFGLKLDYFINCFVDMHAMETYMCWILALPADTVYSELGVSIVQLYGSGDYAVFGENGETLATIKDGKVDFETVHEPIGANSFMADSVSIGLPANRNFSLALSKESLISTKIKMKIQRFTPYGQLIDETETVKLWPNNWKLYCFEGGRNTYLEDANPVTKKVYYREANKIKDKGDLHEDSEFKVWWEFSGSASGAFNFGTHIGAQKVYGSILAGHSFFKPFRALEISPGVGHQDILSGRLLLDTEFFGNFFYTIDSKDVDSGENKFNFVPTLRFSLSFKPKHKSQLFGGVNLDFLIRDFNEGAFDEIYRIKATELKTPSKLRIVPNIQFGIRF